MNQIWRKSELLQSIGIHFRLWDEYAHSTFRMPTNDFDRTWNQLVHEFEYQVIVTIGGTPNTISQYPSVPRTPVRNHWSLADPIELFFANEECIYFSQLSCHFNIDNFFYMQQTLKLNSDNWKMKKNIFLGSASDHKD